MRHAERLSMNVTLTEIILLCGFALIQLSLKLFAKFPLKKEYIMSFAAGVGVSYVVVHLLPALGNGQAVINASFGWNEGILHRFGIYLIVWVGFVLSYVSHRVDDISARKMKMTRQGKEMLYYYSDIGFFSLYNLISGYLLIDRDFTSLRASIIYFSAIGLHFLMIAWGLQHHHGSIFERSGKWILSACLLAGGVLGIFVQFHLSVVYVAEALLTGAMVLNSIRFELPIDHQASLGSFLFGTVLATVLFILL